MLELVAILALVLLLILIALVLYLPRGLRRHGAQEMDQEARLLMLKEGIEKVERTLREELARVREESGTVARQGREELGGGLREFGDAVGNQVAQIGALQKDHLDSFGGQIGRLTTMMEDRLDRMRGTVEERLRSLQEENSAKLERVRETVDEKLHETLERRLSESFRLVSDRLEQVHKGLGEMQTLASGVGDLKKVLTNIKARGIFGEVQLGALLEQVLTREQYERNVVTRPGSNERVEFAVRLPGRNSDGTNPVWLPIDAKFPQEDYQRLVDAQEAANPVALEEASRSLEVRIKNEARSIREKYLDPPHTTDFGIMFLPTEGLFAEVIRRPGLSDILQREFRVLVTGPTTLLALLSSLQMGFRTLAIEKRSSEVWSLLGTVKTEFGKFGDILEKTQKKLQEASNSIEGAATRSRQIERKLRDVQDLPAGNGTQLLESPDTEPEAR
jgi:DNA recombination protein RmuC